MNSERWQQVKGIFDAVVELESGERERSLDELCGEDGELRREVETLLVASDDAESFMESPAIGEVVHVLPLRRGLDAGTMFRHYEIIRLIGEGGMGEVYLAKDKKLDRRVAVKVLNAEHSRHESDLQRFIQEAKAASGLNHPNILVIHEIGESETSNYIVSEFVEGYTLRELIERSPMRLTELLDISIQIANALVAAHSAHIVHRDIKPENIIVRPDGFVKILDFGLAKLVGQKAIGAEACAVDQNQTAKGVILGTVNYMSPEQAKGEKIDERTDIFSFGAVLYEMIAGQPPFKGDSISQSFANLINAEPLSLSRFVEGVPTELQTIVTKALRKNTSERYQAMGEFLRDLKDLRENLAFDARLERSGSSSEMAVLQLTKGDRPNQTLEVLNSTGQIKTRKPIGFIVIAALLVGAICFGYYFYSVRQLSKVKKSLAVLPFVNTGQDADAEYLSDGITESIINNLSQLSQLKVMSRNSAFRFRKDQTDTRGIAAQLGVETLITGDIKQIGDKFVINVRLIDAGDDSQIWGRQYVRTSADMIGVQNEIAQAVVQNLRVKLTTSEQQKLAKNYTANVEAYQLYLRGRFHVFKLTPPEVSKGISYFQQAIEIDPNYALAYTGISDAHRSLAVAGEMAPTEYLAKSKAAALKAIEIDEVLSEGHTSLGMTLFWGEWDWSGAENQYQRALELNPNDANAHLFYAHLLSNLGRHAEALSEAKITRELDPLFPFAGALEGQFLLHAGQPDAAIARFEKTIELAPNFWMPHLFMSSAYIEKGMYPEAIAEARKAKELLPAQTVASAIEGYALAKSGNRIEAQALLDGLLTPSNERFVPPIHIAMILNGLGERGKALDWLEKSFEQRDPKLAFLKVDPKWNNLRNEERFAALIRRMNLD